MSKYSKKRYVKSHAVKELENLKLQKLKEKYPSNPYPPKSKYKDNTANGLTRCVIDFLQFSGFQAERISSMGRQIDRREKVTDFIGRTRVIGSVSWVPGTSTNGTADISAIVAGRSVKIEIKCRATGDKYQSESQKEYQAEVEQAGGIYLIVRDFEEFHEWFKSFCNGEG